MLGLHTWSPQSAGTEQAQEEPVAPRIQEGACEKHGLARLSGCREVGGQSEEQWTESLPADRNRNKDLTRERRAGVPAAHGAQPRKGRLR